MSSCCRHVSDVESDSEEKNMKGQLIKEENPKKHSSDPCESNLLDIKGNHKNHKDAIENKEVDCKILKNTTFSKIY